MTAFRPLAPRRARLSPWLAGWLLAVLLGAQLLGQWHRIEHARPAQGSEESAAAKLWGHSLGSEDCRALDQLGQNLGLDFFSLPALLAVASFALYAAPLHQASLSARWQRGARAPPVLA